MSVCMGDAPKYCDEVLIIDPILPGGDISKETQTEKKLAFAIQNGHIASNIPIWAAHPCFDAKESYSYPGTG